MAKSTHTRNAPRTSREGYQLSETLKKRRNLILFSAIFSSQNSRNGKRQADFFKLRSWAPDGIARITFSAISLYNCNLKLGNGKAILRVVVSRSKFHSCVSPKHFFGDPQASAQRLHVYCHQSWISYRLLTDYYIPLWLSVNIHVFLS